MLFILNSRLKVPLTHYDIEFKRVNFSYNNEMKGALRDISLTIRWQEKVAIMGHTGAGKSTLVNLLSRLCAMQSGAITLGDVDIEQLTQEQLRASITHIPQNPFIFNASIRENLLLAQPEATDGQLLEALEQVRLDKFISELPEGLDTWCGEFGAQLSGGQCRRMALARAILHDAPITVLDEPTEGLDQATASEMMQKILQLTEEKTLIIITHNARALPGMQRVITMEEGRMIKPTR